MAKKPKAKKVKKLTLDQAREKVEDYIRLHIDTEILQRSMAKHAQPQIEWLTVSRSPEGEGSGVVEVTFRNGQRFKFYLVCDEGEEV